MTEFIGGISKAKVPDDLPTTVIVATKYPTYCTACEQENPTSEPRTTFNLFFDRLPAAYPLSRNGDDALGRAYRNVAYGADAAWTSGRCPIQRASMELRLREDLVASRTSLNRLLPRTVRDCIPESRLARYGDYQYVKNRELCYTPAAAAMCEDEDGGGSGGGPLEPWTLREVDELFARFVDYRDGFRDSEAQRRRYDVFRSPFFEASSSEEIVLKLKTVGVKRYWEKDKSYHQRNPLITKDKVLYLYKSPTGTILISEENPSEKYKDEKTFFKDIPEIDRYFSHLRELSHSFKEQTFWISTRRRSPPRLIAVDHSLDPWLEAGAPVPDDYDHPHRRLYSAVLQGARGPRPPPPPPAARDEGRMVLLGKGAARAYDAAQPNGTALLAQLAVQHAQAAACRALTNGGARRAQWAWLTGDGHAHRPVAASRSEELELQALRQYTSSETELEREAAEQYEGPPENCPRPPNREPFGGRAWWAPLAAAAALC